MFQCFHFHPDSSSIPFFRRERQRGGDPIWPLGLAFGGSNSPPARAREPSPVSEMSSECSQEATIEQTMRTSGVAALLLWQCRQPAAFRIIGNLRTQAPIRTALTASTRSRGIESSDTCNINNDMRNPKRRDAVSIFTSISASIALGIPFPSHAVKGAGECVIDMAVTLPTVTIQVAQDTLYPTSLTSRIRP